MSVQIMQPVVVPQQSLHDQQRGIVAGVAADGNGGGNGQQQQQQQQPQLNAAQSNQYNQVLNQVVSGALQQLQRGQFANQVPAFNKFEMQGRTGLIDPANLDQATMLPRLDERFANHQFNTAAIARSLPQGMFDSTNQLVKMAEMQPFQLEKQMKQTDSIYSQASGQQFIANRIKIALKNKRVNSIYATM